jgi:TetR/AcrR family transcriptional regulator, regulator of cefoperazone and chloramphenicol sensitivity
MASDSRTKERLIGAATRVFAERGFNDTTVREISALAGANLAAVNYHFGSKDKLYAAVLENFLQSTFGRFPVDDGVSPGSAPEARLKAYIRGFLHRLQGDGDPLHRKLGKLLMTELLEPSKPFETIVERYIGPTYAVLQDIIAKFLPDADPETVQRCGGSVVGQCLLFSHARGIIQRMCPELSLETDGIGRAADFIFEFSLGGIARLSA